MGPNNFLNFIRQKIFHAHKAHSILINENIQTKKVSKWWSVFKYSCVAAVGCAGMATATISIGGSTWDPIRAIANTGAEGVENKYYLDLVVPEKTNIEQYSEYVVQAVGNDWMHRRVEWSIESVSTLEGVEYRTEGKKNEFFIIKNNLNSFYSKDFKITAYVSVIIASADLVCVGKTKDDFRDRNKPIVAEPVILTEEESYAKTYSGLSELFATKSSVALDELNYIQYNPELSVQEKIDKTNELCVTKHINLIDHNTFEKYKEEFIQSSYDEILNTDLITDEQKLEYIGLLTKQIDETFTEIQEQNFITNSELSKYLNDYYLNISQDFSNVSPKMFSASSENKTEEIKENILKNNLAEFSNSNKIVLSNSNVFAEDIINEQFELDEDFSLKNTNYLNNFFQFNDYFGNKTQNLNDSVYNIDILTKISNIEEFENSLNFNLEYKFDLENSEAQFFNFELGLKFPKQQPVVDIDTFFNDHSFSLNKDYGWDNVEENYWDKMFEYQLQENDKNFSFDFDDDGHHITTWRDEDILFWYDHWWNNITSYLKSMNISLDFNENKIDGATIDNIDNNNMTIAELKNKNIINSFDWSLNMFGEGSVDYRGVLGGITPNYVSHTANLTNFNPKYINKGIKWVAPEGGSELHDICWNAHIDENKIILKNGIDGLYLYFLPESIKVENYFFGNHYSFGGHNDIIKGDFNMFNNNPGFKINPYQADVVNEGLENLLFLDGEAYNQEKYKDFKVDLVLKNIKFENGNTSYINENSELCGVISYAIIIEDLRNGASKMFDLDDAFLEKNITEEMLFEVIKKLDYIYGRLQVNIIKYTLLLTANVIHTIASVTVQTALLVYQILNLVKIVVAAASLPWSTMLFLYFIVELASTINAAIELILFLNEKINYITELIIHIANLLNFNIKTNEKVKLIDDFHIRRMKELKGAYNYIDLIGLISVIGFRQIENLISSINIRFVKKISKDILDTSKDLMNNSLGNYFEKILKINNKVKTFKMEKIWGVSVVLILMVINFGINIAFDSSVELILFLFDYEDKK